MQFSIIVAALAATASAQYAITNGTSSAVGTGSLTPSVSATGAPTRPTSQIPFTGAAAMPTAMAGSALGLVVAGGVAMVSLLQLSPLHFEQ